MTIGSGTMIVAAVLFHWLVKRGGVLETLYSSLMATDLDFPHQAEEMDVFEPPY